MIASYKRTARWKFDESWITFKRASRKKVVDEVDTTDFKEPQQIPIIQEKKFKPIVFV